MLTDTKLKNLKPQAKMYKVSDRDGLYVMSLITGLISSLSPHLCRRRETWLSVSMVVMGITLAEARDELIAAKNC